VASPTADYARAAQPRESGWPVTPGLYFDLASGLNLLQGTQLANAGRRIGAFFLATPPVIVTLGIGYLI